MRALNQISRNNRLIANLIYGSGLGLMETLRLRVKDVDFNYSQIFARSVKGDKDRITVLPEIIIAPLKEHLRKVKALHEADLSDFYGRILNIFFKLSINCVP